MRLLPTTSIPSGETCSRWRTHPCPRSPTAAASHERCRSETQVAHGSFFHLDAILKLSRWDLRQKTPPMVVRSIGKHQHLLSVLRVRQSDGVSRKVLSIAARGQLLFVLPCFLRDRPIPRNSLDPALNSPQVLLQQHPKGLDNLCLPRKRRPQPVYVCKSCISSPAVCGRCMLTNLLKRFGCETPFHTTRSRYRRTSVLQTTKNLIEIVQQIIFVSPPPHHVINPDLAVQAGQQLGHHTLEVDRYV